MYRFIKLIGFTRKRSKLRGQCKGDLVPLVNEFCSRYKETNLWIDTCSNAIYVYCKPEGSVVHLDVVQRCQHIWGLFRCHMEMCDSCYKLPARNNFPYLPTISLVLQLFACEADQFLCLWSLYRSHCSDSQVYYSILHVKQLYPHQQHVEWMLELPWDICPYLIFHTKRSDVIRGTPFIQFDETSESSD